MQELCMKLSLHLPPRLQVLVKRHCLLSKALLSGKIQYP